MSRRRPVQPLTPIFHHLIKEGDVVACPYGTGKVVGFTPNGTPKVNVSGQTKRGGQAVGWCITEDGRQFNPYKLPFSAPKDHKL